jgi:hypothetical protein
LPATPAELKHFIQSCGYLYLRPDGFVRIIGQDMNPQFSKDAAQKAKEAYEKYLADILQKITGKEPTKEQSGRRRRENPEQPKKTAKGLLEGGQITHLETLLDAGHFPLELHADFVEITTAQADLQEIPSGEVKVFLNHQKTTTRVQAKITEQTYYDQSIEERIVRVGLKRDTLTESLLVQNLDQSPNGICL